MFRVSHNTDKGTKYLLDRNNEIAYFFTKGSAETMAFQISEGIPEIEERIRIEQVTTLEDTVKSDYFD